MQQRISEISVTPSGNNILWKVDADSRNFDKRVTLRVATGCTALIYVNGIYSETCYKDTPIDRKNILRDNNSLTIYGVNSQKSFELLFGFGEIVFHDPVIDDTTEVGIRGVCTFKVADAKKLHMEMGGDKDVITADDIRRKFFAGLETAVRSQCSEVFERHGYRDVQKALQPLSDIIKRQVERQMYNSGILLESCSVTNVHFQEGYTEKFQEQVKNDKNALTEHDDKEQQLLRDLKIIKELGNIQIETSKAEAEGRSAAAAGVCPYCKSQNAVGAKYCNRCGRKIG